MRAAVVHSFDQPPRFADFQDPTPEPNEELIQVSAAALSNLVKGQASGRHYSSGGQLPLVPGHDGVGRTADGKRVYFLSPRAHFGSMAERTVVSKDRLLPLPDAVDDITAAAIGNPGLASWGALLGRARLQPGETVLVHGATGVSGQQAVQVAKYLGARRVIATGRDAAKLEATRALGADETISLQQPQSALQTAFGHALHDNGGTQVVLDYLYGPTAALIMQSAASGGSLAGEPRIRYVQIGSAAGRTVELSAEWLRSSGLEVLGSGLGSLPLRSMLDALSVMFAAWAKGSFKVRTQVVPLRQVEQAWTQTEAGLRTVFTV